MTWLWPWKNWDLTGDWSRKSLDLTWDCMVLDDLTRALEELGPYWRLVQEVFGLDLRLHGPRWLDSGPGRIGTLHETGPRSRVTWFETRRWRLVWGRGNVQFDVGKTCKMYDTFGLCFLKVTFEDIISNLTLDLPWLHWSQPCPMVGRLAGALLDPETRTYFRPLLHYRPKF